jgi:predicted Zn-dependent protease
VVESIFFSGSKFRVDIRPGFADYEYMKRPAVFVLLAIYFFSGCATSKNTPPFSQTPSIANEEVAIGEKIHAQILSSFYAYTDPKVVEYINKVGQSLAARAERKDLPYRFTIIYN